MWWVQSNTMNKNNNLVYWVVLVLWLLPLKSYAAQAISIEADGNSEIITLALPRTSPNKAFLLARPDRLVIDVPNMASKPAARLPADYDGELLKALRIGQFDPQTARFVFELAKPATLEGVEENERAGSLAITISGVAAGKPPTKMKKERSRKISAPSKPVVVIDAGHGGVDPGTIGSHGTQEKNVVLEIARQLQLKLQKTGRYEAQLTRSGDYFIMLRKRIEIARKQKASIFISLHADSAPEKQARGLSVYTVSEQASDKEAEALAARENKSDVIGGMDLSHEREDVAEILISLAQRETMNRSATLADVLVDALEEEVNMLPNSHRFAGFAVLKSPDVPSVLIETGFLSHPKEEKLLKTKAYREKLIAGIVAGIDAYFNVVGNEQEK